MKGTIGAIIAGIIIFGSAIGVMACTERIPAGYVGVVYSMNGGVQEDVLTQGWKFVGPTKKVTKYSVATEQLYMSSDKREGSSDNDSFDVICRDGKMNVDLEMSYSFDAEQVDEVYTRYRGMSGENIIHNIVRGKIKTYTNEITSKYSVLEAHMEKKSELNREITEHLRKKLSEFGVIVESANLTQTRVDAAIEQAITERSKAAQELEAEKQKSAKAKVEAERLQIETQAQADKKKIEAQAEADAMLVKAKAEAEANKLLQQSLTKELIELERIKAWDGKYPQFMGEGINPIMNMN